MLFFRIVALAFGLLAMGAALAQEEVGGAGNSPSENKVAAVVIDGKPLFNLRGISSYPAATRVEGVRERIIAAARDPAISANDVKLVHLEDRTGIYAGETLLFSVFEADAEFEGVERQTLAEVLQARVIASIQTFRTERTAEVLRDNTLLAAGVTVAMLIVLWGLLHILRWVDRWLAGVAQHRLQKFADKAHQLIRVSQVWALLTGLVRTFRVILVALLLYFYLNTVLGLYPWTRPIALVLFGLILDPLESLWLGFLAAIPKLVFLIILFIVVRYLLKLTRLFFDGVGSGSIKLKKFDADWALPTFKIVRVLVIAFSLVVAYPYIPGSDSLAFKGVSLFLGVMFSLGSTSFIANMLAGLAMTYRGVFKVDDIVRIGDVVGRVEETNLMITRIRSPKNESVAIPNSNILNTNVTSYTALARSPGLILHSEVGIGYDTPWRQVEAMLLLAAKRTEGLLVDPPPFVLQRSLGDFTVIYEINAYCDDPGQMMVLYSKLHGNIQDVFNEHGVQIMSPNYVADPESPKMVPPDQWYAAPATVPQS